MIVLIAVVEARHISIIEQIAILIDLENLSIAEDFLRVDAKRNQDSDVMLTGKIAQRFHLFGI